MESRIPAPMSLPSFQGSRYGVEDIVCTCSTMVSLLSLLFGPQDFHTWGRREDLAEVVHPVPGVFG